MLNRRTFLLGLGTGIIIGALLLQLFYLGQDSQKNLNEIGQQLESPGTQQGEDGALQEQTGEAEADQELPPSPDAAEQTDQAQQTPVTDSAADAKQSENNAQPTLRLIQIEHGMKLIQVAEILLANEIINDAEAFTRMMLDNDKKARAGYYALAEGAGTEQAVKAVTGQPLSKEEAEKRVAEQQS